MSESAHPQHARGRLRVYLGAAPGVGKTYKMLEEGRRRLERGTDVVVGLVETHGRERTRALLADLEVVPRRRVTHRGAELDDMDLDAVLARRPQVALVDEMAHTNVPGSRHDKRWEDIDELLDAGIDVITTVNVQHLESLNDALTRITGVQQLETIPDDVVRRADQIELVDMAPEALRRRIVHGNVYSQDRVEAALGNYFRVGNLSALRELALLWVADRVDDELLGYREQHGIDRPWETRERIVVAITGAPSGEQLIRRAARMAERSRAELLGVHVRRSDGLTSAHDEGVAAHRQLLADLGGSYHEVVGDDAAEQVVGFARAENATQIVLGTSRRTRFDELLHGSVINRAIKAAHDIDVHVIAHDGAESRHHGTQRRIRRPPPIGVRRRMAAWAVAVGGPLVLTATLLPFRGEEGLSAGLPPFMLVVVAAAVIGGTAPALSAAVVGFTLGNVALTRPYGTLRIGEFPHIVALASFLAVAVIVAVVVGQRSRRGMEARRSRAQAQSLASAAASLAASDDAVPMLLDKLRSTLDLDAVVIERRDGTMVSAAGNEGGLDDLHVERIDLPDGSALVCAPAVTDADDRMVVRAFADQLATALHRSELAAGEAQARALAEIDQFRTALLRAVSHDLRTPLAAIKASASSLGQDDVVWPDEARREFVTTIVEEVDRLDRIVSNLLDASRLEAGVLAVRLSPVEVAEVFERALSGAPPGIDVTVDAPDGTPLVMADGPLLERVVENLLVNAARYAPGKVELVCSVDTGAGVARLGVVDHGPGVPREMYGALFQGFRRLDDRGAGVGLGLAVAHGFVDAMGGLLVPNETPGGGLWLEIVLPLAEVCR